MSNDDIQKVLKKGLFFIPLGGSSEIGMNLNVLCCDGQYIIIDMGVCFGDHGIPGITVKMADISYLEKIHESGQLIGIIITHAHEDHAGALAYLWPYLDVPVYTTAFTARFLEEKFKPEGLDYQTIIHVIPLGGSVTLGPFHCEFYILTHSIPEPNAIIITTPYGRIFHTGDWRLDPAPCVSAPIDLKALSQRTQNIDAVIGDSTNVFTLTATFSEQEISEKLREIFCSYQGRIFVTCFASNVARFKNIIREAHDSDRAVVLVGRSLWRMVDIAKDTGYFDDLRDILLVRPEKMHEIKNGKNVLFICTGSQGETKTALNAISRKTYKNIQMISGDLVIFSSRIIPGNERSIFRLYSRLIECGAKIMTSYEEPKIHASGHPSQEELKILYDVLQPKVLIPVHGERYHLTKHFELSKEFGIPASIVPDNGMVIDLSAMHSGKVSSLGHVEHGYLGLEGERIVPLYSSFLKKRQKLSELGMIVISCVVDKDDYHLVSKIFVQGNGVLDLQQEENISLEQEIQTIMNGHLTTDTNELEFAIMKHIKKLYKNIQGHAPYVTVIIHAI